MLNLIPTLKTKPQAELTDKLAAVGGGTEKN